MNKLNHIILNFVKKNNFKGRARIVSILAKINRKQFEHYPLYIGEFKYPIFINLNDKTGVYLFLNNGLPHERQLQAIIEEVADSNLNFWDIGTNYGFYPWLFLNKSIYNNIYCFEPNLLLKENLDLTFKGNLKKIKINNIALGESKGVLDFYYNKDKTDIGSFNINSPSMSNNTFKIEIDTIDNLTRIYKKPDVMKIDVEGFEYNVLKGYSKNLNIDYPIIFMEWITEFQSKSFEELKNLFDESWLFYKITKNGLSNSLETAGSDIIAISKNNIYFNKIFPILKKKLI
jgi:FkbM family methyltransferase